MEGSDYVENEFSQGYIKTIENNFGFLNLLYYDIYYINYLSRNSIFYRSPHKIIIHKISFYNVQ